MAVTASAQSRFGVEFGGFAGFPVHTGVTNWGFNVGGTYEYGFDEHWAGRTKLLFHCQHSGVDFLFIPIESVNSIGVEVPFLATYQLPLGKRFGLAFSAGPYVKYNIALRAGTWKDTPKEKRDETYYAYDEGKISVPASKRWDVGAQLEVAARWKHWQIGMGVQYGLNHSYASYNGHDLNVLTHVGYQF